MTAPTLAQIVDENPAAARILERHHLDYCCGGKKSLADACAESGVDADAVLAELADTAGSEPRPEWMGLDIAALADHVESTHHAYLHEEMPRLDALCDKVLSVHGANHPELAEVSKVVKELRADLEPHLAKEERVLFPMIRELEGATEAPSFHCGSLGNPIRMMLMEHDQTGEILTRLRAATRDYWTPADACGSYRALYEGLEQVEVDTHLHVHKENNHLFPAVLAAESQLAAPTA